MKPRRLLGLLATCCGVLGIAFAAQPTPVASVGAVYVGHSLINNWMPYMVKSLAASVPGLGYRQTVQVIPGATIIYNWNNCRQATAAQTWGIEYACDAIENATPQAPVDTLIVTMANGMYWPDHPDWISSTPEEYNLFLQLFKSRQPTGRAFYFTQWEHQDSSRLVGRDWTDWIAEELGFYERVVERTELLYQQATGQSVDVTIIPAALGLRDLIWEAEAGRIPGLTSRNQIFTDTVHLNYLGNYFLACIVFASIYERSPEGATGRTIGMHGDVMTDLDPTMTQKLQSLAWKVVSNYRGWTATTVRPRAPGGFQVH
jgi:hypothetical protein